MQAYIHTYIHTHVHTYIHTYAYANIHMREPYIYILTYYIYIHKYV
jgi:hypothetical protein